LKHAANKHAANGGTNTKKYLILLLALAFVFSMVAYAGSGNISTASIDIRSEGATGPFVRMYGRITLSGESTRNSTRVLYVACDADETGIARTEPLDPGETLVGITFDDGIDYYRIMLDPAGPLFDGCEGSGMISNP